jgi:hypothetical protein
MRGHLSEGEMAGYRNKNLTPNDLVEAADHLAACELCRNRLLEGVPLRRLDLPGDVTHLSYRQIAAYVDHDLNEIDTEIARSHIELCSQCEDEVRDLQQFRTEFSRSPISEPVSNGPDSRRGRWTNWFRFGIPAAVAATALLAIFVMRTEPVLVALNDGGGRVTLYASGKLGGIDRVPEGYQAVVRTALESGRAEFPAELSTLSAGGGVLRGTTRGESFPLLGPIATFVDTDRPQFRWGAVPGAEFYVVEIFAAGARLVSSSSRLMQQEWTPESPLPRGIQLTWQVKARRAGRDILAPTGDAPEARFEILPESRSAELADARRRLAGFHLLLGLTYAKAGVLDDAERELAALAQANPSSQEARRLLENVRAARAAPLR